MEAANTEKTRFSSIVVENDSNDYYMMRHASVALHLSIRNLESFALDYNTAEITYAFLYRAISFKHLVVTLSFSIKNPLKSKRHRKIAAEKKAMADDLAYFSRLVISRRGKTALCVEETLTYFGRTSTILMRKTLSATRGR